MSGKSMGGEKTVTFGEHRLAAIQEQAADEGRHANEWIRRAVDKELKRAGYDLDEFE